MFTIDSEDKGMKMKQEEQRNCQKWRSKTKGEKEEMKNDRCVAKVRRRHKLYIKKKEKGNRLIPGKWEGKCSPEMHQITSQYFSELFYHQTEGETETL